MLRGYRVIYLHNFPTAFTSVAGVDVLARTMAYRGDSLFIHGATLGLETVF